MNKDEMLDKSKEILKNARIAYPEIWLMREMLLQLDNDQMQSIYETVNKKYGDNK